VLTRNAKEGVDLIGTRNLPMSKCVRLPCCLSTYYKALHVLLGFVSR